MTNAPWDNDQGQGGPDIESSPLTGDSLTPPKIEWGVFEKGSLPPNLALDSAANESLLPMATKPKRRGGAVIGGLVGLAALAGGGIFAYRAFSSDPPKNTPEQAVTALLTAAQNRDVIGLAEALAPGERDALLDGVLPAVDELKRLEILDPSLNLHKVPASRPPTRT